MSSNFIDTFNDTATCRVTYLNCSTEETMLSLNSEIIPASALIRLDDTINSTANLGIIISHHTMFKNGGSCRTHT